MKATQIHRLKPLLAVLLLFSFITSCQAADTMDGIHLDRIELPPGFKIRLYAAGVPNARSLTMSPSGVIFVGSRQAGKVYAVLDTDQDHVADEVITIAAELSMPNGVALSNFHRRARIMEPQHAYRLSHHPRHAGQEQADEL